MSETFATSITKEFCSVDSNNLSLFNINGLHHQWFTSSMTMIRLREKAS